MTGTRRCALGVALTVGSCCVAPVRPDAASDVVLGYDTKASWTSQAGGHETGLVAIATDPASPMLDVVTASGNDGEIGPLALFSNRSRIDVSSPFHVAFTGPDWHSADSGFHTGLAAGRITDDEHLDLVTLEFLETPALTRGDTPTYFAGALKLYRGHSCKGDAVDEKSCRNAEHAGSISQRFERQPGQRIGGLYALGLALGDANGDARLDVAVPIITSDPPPISLIKYGFDRPPSPASTQLFFNHGGEAPFSTSTATESPTTGTSAIFADVDQDGLTDLVVGGSELLVHFGRRKDGAIDIDPVAGWRAQRPSEMDDRSLLLVTSVDAGWLRQGKRRVFGIVAGFGCPRIKVETARECGGGVATFVVRRGVEPEREWVSPTRLGVSHVRLVDVDGIANSDATNINDIVFDTWVDPGHDDGSLHIATGRDDGTFVNDAFVSATRFVGEQIIARDLSALSLDTRKERLEVAATVASAGDFTGCDGRVLVAGSRAITLCAVNIHDVRAISITRGKEVLTPRWRFVEDSHAIVISADLLANDIVDVEYRTSANLDLVVATFDVGVGLVAFLKETDSIGHRDDPSTAP